MHKAKIYEKYCIKLEHCHCISCHKQGDYFTNKPAINLKIVRSYLKCFYITFNETPSYFGQNRYDGHDTVVLPNNHTPLYGTKSK